MSDDQNTYRPRSPDFSATGNQHQHPHPHHHHAQPPPRLTRLPSYQIQEPSLPKDYSFSPRGSYDASPFFSPITQQPPPSYFNFPPVASPQATPSGPPRHQSQPNLAIGPVFSESPPRLPNQGSFDSPYSRPLATSIRQSPPSISNHQQLQQLHFDDMARLRQRKPVNYNENQNGPSQYDEPTPLPSVVSQPITAPAPYPQIPQPAAPAAELVPPQYAFPLTTKMASKIDIRTKFPVARIKRIMQADEDVGKVAQATPSAVSKALELFMIALVSKGAAEAKTQNSKRITATHLKNALLKDPQFDFLNEVCESVPDEGSRKRGKSETKDSDSEDDGDPKRKPKGRRKKTGSEMESD